MGRCKGVRGYTGRSDTSCVLTPRISLFLLNIFYFTI